MSTIKLLVVEDEESALNRYREYIKEYQGGYELTAAAKNFNEAVSCFNQLELDCIFTDIVIPGGDGLKFIEYIRRKGFKGPVVVVSGYDRFSYAQKALKLGAEDYLLKPVFKSEYFKMLDKIRFLLGGFSAVVNKYRDPALPSFLLKAMDYVEHNYSTDIHLAQVAEQAGVSPTHLSASFPKYIGITFIEFLKYYRIQVVISMLENSPVDCSLNEIAESAGFCDASYLNNCFKRQMGVTPRKYQTDYYERTKGGKK